VSLRRWRLTYPLAILENSSAFWTFHDLSILDVLMFISIWTCAKGKSGQHEIAIECLQVDIDQRRYPLAGHIMIYSECIKSICMRHLISRKAYSYRCLLCGATRSRRTCQTAACGDKWQWNHDGGGTWTPSHCKQFYCNPWPPLKWKYHATFRYIQMKTGFLQFLRNRGGGEYDIHESS